ncbi:MAG: hypothetical protein AB7S26_02985 [Sandaracinaceae bacterium]
MYSPFSYAVAWVIGGMLIGIAGSGLGLAWWWAGPRQRLSTLAVLGRAGLSFASVVMLLVGLVLVSTGTEHALSDPLGRWGGAPMVWELWFVLALAWRDAVWSAAHARAGGSVGVARAFAGLAALLWLASSAMFVLSGFVAVWALLGI